jgi:hypothetical protein
MPKDWTIPAELQPDPMNYMFNLDAVLNAVVALRATAPADAFTATALGTEREGSGVVIGDDGLILTIGRGGLDHHRRRPLRARPRARLRF